MATSAAVLAGRDGDREARRLCPRLSPGATVGASSVALARRIGGRLCPPAAAAAQRAARPVGLLVVDL